MDALRRADQRTAPVRRSDSRKCPRGIGEHVCVEQKLSEVQRTNQHIYRAYLLKESLAQGFEYRQQARASRHIDGWISWATRSKLKPFVKLASTIKKFKEGILAYVKTRLSNGLTEGLNNKTRLITRRAYGFHSAHALAAMIHLCCGGITLYPPLPEPTSTA